MKMANKIANDEEYQITMKAAATFLSAYNKYDKQKSIEMGIHPDLADAARQELMNQYLLLVDQGAEYLNRGKND